MPKNKEGTRMIDKNALCEKIRTLYPEIGECGIDVDVDYDQTKQAWIVDLKKGTHQLKTHLEPPDANACLEGKQCVSLGMQISLLVSNIEKD
jgi:hypothetical protein